MTTAPAEDGVSAGPPARPYTLVYDGHCNVCRGFVGIVEGRDRLGEIELLPAETPGLLARFPWIPAHAYAESIQVIENRDGTTHQGAAAVERVLDILPKGGLISWIFSIPFARPLAEKFYRWFARNRYQLGCGEHCQLRESGDG